MVVLDASVLLKWFYPREAEEDADTALAFRRRLLEGRLTIAVPSFALYEAAHSLRHSTYRLPPATVRARIRDLWSMGVTRVPITRRLLWSAVEMSFLYNVPVYDAYYFAVAQHKRCPCVTADRRAFRRVRAIPWMHYLGDVRDVGVFDD